ncbi:MAG: hypothetical protein FD134_373 [Gallionellaceae bacterium]|nr:MAG: hypothetical protein FD134_373 [Gallionellaceae bacterium]
MIEYAHVHQRQRLLQRVGQQAVGLARLGCAGRVVVRENHRCRIVVQGALHHLARVNASLREGAVEQLFAGDHAVLRVEEDGHEHLLSAPAQQQLQVASYRARRIQRIAAVHFLLQRAPRHFQHRLQLHVFRLPHAVDFAKILLGGGK